MAECTFRLQGVWRFRQKWPRATVVLHSCSLPTYHLSSTVSTLLTLLPWLIIAERSVRLLGDVLHRKLSPFNSLSQILDGRPWLFVYFLFFKSYSNFWWVQFYTLSYRSTLFEPSNAKVGWAVWPADGTKCKKLSKSPKSIYFIYAPSDPLPDGC